jgi:large subunit ribosomal protein L6
MINKNKEKYLLKIPDNISIFYCNKKKIITFYGTKHQTSIKLKTKLIIYYNLKIIKVSCLPFSTISNKEKKSFKSMQGTMYALIKQKLIETLSIFYQKLKFVGIGHRLIPLESFEDKVILLKLGFSHFFYFKVPNNIKIFYKTRTLLSIIGNSYLFVTQLASSIRTLKKPEPYKGKGILYENEKIFLKIGKRV